MEFIRRVFVPLIPAPAREGAQSGKVGIQSNALGIQIWIPAFAGMHGDLSHSFKSAGTPKQEGRPS